MVNIFDSSENADIKNAMYGIYKDFLSGESAPKIQIDEEESNAILYQFNQQESVNEETGLANEFVKKLQIKK